MTGTSIRLAATFFYAAMAVLFFGVSADAVEQPNVVFVITDDQGYGDLACLGNPVLKTPKIDALHKESVHAAP